MSTAAPSAPSAPAATATRRLAIVGLPNSGKSQLFNSLTGSYELVANYPLTTIEIKEKTCLIGKARWTVADTPGVHALYVQSEEEIAVRDLLLGEPPEMIVQCVDANRFRESLALTADLLGLGLPLVVFLTAVGESIQRGTRIEAQKLAKELGVPVVQSPAPGKGLPDLLRVLDGAVARPAAPRWGEPLESAVARVEDILPPGTRCPRTAALLLLENDPSFEGAATEGGIRAATEGGIRAATRGGIPAAARPTLEAVRAGLAGKAPLMVNDARNRWVDRVAAAAAVPVRPARAGFSETFAAMCRHPVYGLPILAVFLGVLYLMVVYVAGALSLALTTALADPVVAFLGRFLPAGFWRDLLIGQHGLLTLGLFNSITTVLPILTVFFLVFGVMEDVGYLPNLAILTRRVSGRLGVTGNAIIPLVLGLGCKTMATMSSRTLHSRRERLIVVTLIGFAIPCSAQTGLSIAILGRHGVRYFLLAFGMLVVAELIVGLVLNRILPREEKGQFIQELPPIRLPSLLAVGRKTGYRLLWFLKEAIPIFLVAALAMFVIDRIGLLGLLKDALKPFMTGWLGLPVDMVDALLLSLARSEAAAGYILRMSQAGALNGLQSVVAVVLLTTFAQCFANIGAMVKEIGAKAAALVVVSIYVMSFAWTGAVHGLLVLLSRVVPL
jgi:ferrous iron transport protein B